MAGMAAKRVLFGAVLATTAVGVVAFPVLACDLPIGRIEALRGEALLISPSGVARPASLNMPVCPDDLLRTQPFATAVVSLHGEDDARPQLRIGDNSIARIKGRAEQRWWVELTQGLLYIFSRRAQSLSIDTPIVSASVEGTEFLVDSEAQRARVIVYEGTVVARNTAGEARLSAGQSLTAGAGEALRAEIAVRPWDAVAWAIYYPPILLLDSGTAAATAATDGRLEAALARAKGGDVGGALADLDAVATDDAGAPARVLRAAILLGAGRVADAGAELDQAPAVGPGAAQAYALRSVIATAQNDKATALAFAEQAVSLDATSAAAKIALSYAQQADFRTVEARQTMQAAVRDEPGNALAWTRLAELWLAAGERRRAREAAQKAEALAPTLDRTQTILGFAYLAEIRTRRARDAFERAIELNAADPLPRFGLGLARIRDGHLGRGRADLETAVALDPASALLRSYLGLAYFEARTTDPLTYFRDLWERWPAQENALAASQFETAKQLDPQDPTPWFYDAIRKQSENRPVEALRDLERSIALNDNRGVYRTQDLLNSDLAGRGASVARIYNDLGFEQLGLNEASKAIALDPSNSAAHRFLSDVYSTQPRRETARVSELLQAQLLQDVNINPVSPSFGATNLGISPFTGVPSIGLNEYTPLFERNRAQLNVAGFAGSNWTRGNEAIVSGVYDRISLSAGHLYYESDGFRENNDLRTHVLNFYAQAAVSPELNVQTEQTARRSDYGARNLPYVASELPQGERNDLDQGIARVGVRYEPNADSAVLASFIYARRSFQVSDSLTSPGIFDLDVERRLKTDEFQGELSYLYTFHDINFNVGTGVYDVDNKLRDKIAGDLLGPFDQRSVSDFDTRHFSQFAYINVTALRDLIVTLGMSQDVYEGPDRDFSKWSPKLGVRWTALPNLVLRGAVFRSIKPPLAGDRTIQPAQIAGFDQFFDDTTQTDTWFYGVGIDYAITPALAVGLNMSKRSYDEPVQSASAEDQESLGTRLAQDARKEYIVAPYLYWAISPSVALRANLELDDFTADPDEDVNVPEKVTTISAPLSLLFFSTSGWTASLSATPIYQDVSYQTDPQPADGDNSALVFDASLGYRLPQRRGVIRITALNLTDENLGWRNDSFRTFRDNFGGTPAMSSTKYLPERTFLARVSLSF